MSLYIVSSREFNDSECIRYKLETIVELAVEHDEGGLA
jgi:hypothetical protein